VAEKRLDIQGIRAIAVALVVVFHLWPERLTGGYVGVDAFFVISGFLITGHLLREVDRTGTISLTTFWARRVRRLLPAAFTVLIASLIATLIILPRSLVQQTLAEIGASAVYVQNWLLAGSSVDYLGADNNPTLVQHFWSLSIEEQFYVAWPILILAVLWLALKVNPSWSRLRVIGLALVAVFIASLLYSVGDTAASQSSAYFVTTTRVWEFAAGGLVCFLPRLNLRSASRAVGAHLVLSWFGLTLLIGSAVLFTAESAFPGWIALVPVVGTAMLIYSGESRSTWSPQVFLRFGPSQFLGDISYSVYLWHWPLIVLVPFITDHHLTMVNKLEIIAVTLVLATATRVLIEEPLRRSSGVLRLRRVTFAFMAVGMALIVGIAGVGTAHSQRLNDAFAAQIASSISAGVGCFGASAMIASNKCNEPFAITDTVNPEFTADDLVWKRGVMSNNACALRPDSLVSDCVFGDLDAPAHTIALVGDSHSHALIDPLAIYGKSHGWKVLMYAIPGCTALESDIPSEAWAEEMSSDESDHYNACLNWRDEVLQELHTRTDIDTVIFANRTSLYQMNATQVADSWRSLEAMGKRVVAVRDVPGMADNRKAPACVEANMKAYDPCAWKPPVTADFMTDAAALSGVPLIDLDPYLCDAAGCHAVIGGTIVYYDGNHLSYTFTQTLAPFFGASIAAVL